MFGKNYNELLEIKPRRLVFQEFNETLEQAPETRETITKQELIEFIKMVGDLGLDPEMAGVIPSGQAKKLLEGWKKTSELDKKHKPDPETRKKLKESYKKQITERYEIYKVNESQRATTNYEDYVYKYEKFKENFENKFKGVEKMSDEEKEKFVIETRRKIIELRFLDSYFQNTFQIMEDENGHDVFVKNFDPEGDIKDAKETINFTENSKYTEEVESKLTGIKKGVDQQSIYEQIEEERNQITPREFLKLPLKDRLKLVTNIRSTDELQENTLLVISFGQNEALERQIGLGDLMPPKIRKMECHDGVYSRAGTQGFYANGEYLPIFDGTRVTIIERDENYNPLNDFKFNKEYAKGNEKIEGLEITKNDVMQLALSFQIDPLLLEATLKNVSNIENTDDQFEQAHMAARYIQNAEHKYHAKYPDKELLKDGKYTIEFVLYSLDRFNLFNFYYEQPESVVVNVTKSYGLEYTPEVKAKREEIKPKTPENWGTYTGGEIFYQQDEVVEPTKKMKENLESRMRALKEYYNELVAKGECTREKADKVVSNAERIYKTMDSRMGTWYHDKVAIKRPGENPWVITNNCVGAAMKTIEDSDFRLQRGRQKGKSAANFYWGTYKDGNRDFAGDRKKGFEWLKSMTDSNSQIVEEHLVNPADADAIIGPHLAPGECAPAGLWNHAIWIYKEANGRVMVYHSGGDYRPKRITLQPGEEVPPGYARSGNSNIAWKQYNQKRPPGKQSSSKVNAVPLSYLLAQSTHYRDNKPSFRNAIHFVPLGTLVDANS